jgi:L-lactate dehydrogenase (cytochrome)
MNRDDEKRGGNLTGQEIAKHNSRESCWVIIHGKAYDVTECMSAYRNSNGIE